jgi:hypothetical protein
MKSKTTFWGQVGAVASALQGMGVTGALITNDELQKKILAWLAFVGFVLAGIAKSIAGAAAADADTEPAAKEPPKA